MFFPAVLGISGENFQDHFFQKLTVVQERLNRLFDDGIDDSLLQPFLNHDQEIAACRFQIDVHLLFDVFCISLGLLPKLVCFGLCSGNDFGGLGLCVLEELLSLGLCGRQNLLR